MKGFRRVRFEPKENGIHVANLPPTVTVEFLKSLFSEAGTVINVILKQKPTSCYAFVDFTLQEEAETAVRDFNYTKLNGETIIVTRTTAQVVSAISSGQGNLFIKGLDESIDCLQLHELFANYGEIVSCRIPTLNGQPRGFGYVQFLKQEDAEHAMKELADSTVNGKPIQIGPFLKRSERPLSAAFQNNLDSSFTNVFVKNLPDNINTLLSLLRLFHEFGDVTSARIVPERHIGYVMMSEHEAAVRAVVGLCGRTIFGKRLSVCRSLSPAERANFIKKPIEEVDLPADSANKDKPTPEQTPSSLLKQPEDTLAKAVGSIEMKEKPLREAQQQKQTQQQSQPAPKPAAAPAQPQSPAPPQAPLIDPVLYQQQVNYYYQQQMMQQQMIQQQMYGNPVQPMQPPPQRGPLPINPQLVQPPPQIPVQVSVEPPSSKPAPKPVPKQPQQQKEKTTKATFEPPPKQQAPIPSPTDIMVSSPKTMIKLVPTKEDVLAKPPPPSVPANTPQSNSQSDQDQEPEPELASGSQSDSGNDIPPAKPAPAPAQPIGNTRTRQEYISSSDDDRPVASPANPFGFMGQK